MNDQDKSKEQLIEECSALRLQLKDLQSRKQKNHFENLVQDSPDSILRFDQDIHLLFANPRAITLAGISAATYWGKTITELNLTPKDAILWRDHIKKVFATKQPSTFEIEFINCNGDYRYYHALLVPEFMNNGTVESVLCVLRDIRELKKTTLALSASEKRNNRLLAAMPDLLIYLSNDGVYLDYHTTSPVLTHVHLEKRLGKHVSEVLPLEASQKIMSAIQQAIETDTIQIVEYQLLINNTVNFFETRIINLDDDRVLAIIRNTSEITRLKQEVTRLDQLHLIGEMAAGIGHEVRNPMTTVRGFLQLLQQRPECSSLTSYFSLMIEELDHVNDIISEFLSLAKNKLVKLERQNLNTIIHNMTPLLQSHAAMSNKYFEMTLETIPDLLLDGQEIRQLILNLVHNGLESMNDYTTIKLKRL